MIRSALISANTRRSRAIAGFLQILAPSMEDPRRQRRDCDHPHLQLAPKSPIASPIPRFRRKILQRRRNLLGRCLPERQGRRVFCANAWRTQRIDSVAHDVVVACGGDHCERHPLRIHQPPPHSVDRSVARLRRPESRRTSVSTDHRRRALI